MIVRVGTGVTRRLPRGRGTVQALVDRLLGARHIDLHLNTLWKGSPPSPYHTHTNAENLYFVLDGTIGVRVSGDEYRLDPGDVAFIPPGVPHAIVNIGNVDARFLEVYAPPDADFIEVEEPAGMRRGRRPRRTTHSQ